MENHYLPKASYASAAAGPDDEEDESDVFTSKPPVEPTTDMMMLNIMKMIGTLKSLNIGSHSGASSSDGPQKMQLFIKTLSGETASVELDAATTVEVLKAQLYNKTRRLSHAGKQLKDGHTLQDYNLHQHTTLHEAPVAPGGTRIVRTKFARKSDEGMALKL